MPQPLKVYIAGPYSSAPERNTQDAIFWMNRLLDIGHAPFCPHLTHYPHLRKPRDYEEWMTYDFAWLPCCDVLLRLYGASHGADHEVELARQHGIPVVTLSYHDNGNIDSSGISNTELAGRIESATKPPVDTAKPTAVRRNVLEEANELVRKNRQADYGDPLKNHERIAALWSPILGAHVTPGQVALCMGQVKVSRLIETPNHRDSVVDIAGYASVYASIVGVDAED